MIRNYLRYRWLAIPLGAPLLSMKVIKMSEIELKELEDIYTNGRLFPLGMVIVAIEIN